MLRKSWFIVLILVLVVAACAPQSDPDAAMIESAADQPTAEEPGQSLIVASPQPEGEATGEPQNVIEPSEGESGELPVAPTGETSAEPSGAPQSIYQDDQYGFTVAYPQNAVVAPLDAGALAGYRPQPVAGVNFLGPEAAAAEFPELETPMLSLLVYEAGASASPEAWLEAAGLAAAGSATPYGEGRMPGLEVCRSDDMAPGCAVFFSGDGLIYRLTGLSLEGEAMIASFALTR